MTTSRDQRLQNDHDALMRLSRYSRLVSIRPVRGNPPTEYRIVYSCRGYTRPGVIADRFEVDLTLPLGYPQQIPRFAARTPIHHPHVFGSWICIGGPSGRKWSPAISLRQAVIGVGEMIQWKRAAPGPAVDKRELVGRDEPDETPPVPVPTTERTGGRQTSIPVEIQYGSGPRPAPLGKSLAIPPPKSAVPIEIKPVASLILPAMGKSAVPDSTKAGIAIEIGPTAEVGASSTAQRENPDSRMPPVRIEIVESKTSADGESSGPSHIDIEVLP